MKFGPLNHVGIATPSIEKAVVMYQTLLGATLVREPFDLPEQGVRVCFIDAPNSQIELLEPLGEDFTPEPPVPVSAPVSVRR